MCHFFDLCEKYFGTRDLYKVLNISKDSSKNEVKKAYYKLSLKVHPDRVNEKEKIVATEKFKVLSQIHSLLTNDKEKSDYDNYGTVSGSDVTNWCQYWNIIFKTITIEDIANYEKQYKGSELELYDLKRAYTDGKGDINHIYSSVPFIGYNDEARFIQIILKLIESGELPEYKLFTEEPAKKRKRRHKKYKREANESDNIARVLELQKEDGFTNDDKKDLALIVDQGKRQSSGFTAIFDTLEARCRNKRKQQNVPQHKYHTRTAKKIKIEVKHMK